MYDRPVAIPVQNPREPVGLECAEQSIQSIVMDILDMTKSCRGISYSINNGLFGSGVGNGSNEKPISCLMDALVEIRYILREVIEEMDSVSRRI